MDQEWIQLPQRINNFDISITPANCTVPVKHSKWDDLQSLKSVIPNEFYIFMTTQLNIYTYIYISYTSISLLYISYELNGIVLLFW